MRLHRHHHRHVNFIPLLSFVCLLSIFAVCYHLMRVRKIECFDQFGSCPDEYSRSLSHFIGWPLLNPLPIQRAKADLATFPQIKTVSLYRRLPSVLVVTVSLRNPIGAIGSTVLGAHVAVDQDGVIFASLSQNTLPLLLSPQPLSLSAQVSPDQLHALSALNLANTLFDSPLTGSLAGQDLTIFAPGNLQIILDIANPASNWYTPLQLLLQRSKINAKMPHKIDLRFTNAVITY